MQWNDKVIVPLSRFAFVEGLYPPVKIARDHGQFAALWFPAIAAAHRRPAHRNHAISIRCLLSFGCRVRLGNRDGRRKKAMKTSMVAAAMLALVVMPAHAQMGGKRHQGEDKKTDQPAKKIDEKAYKAALERIPEPKEKYDPWGVARPAKSPK
jgi:hypothetical protein